MDLKKLAVMAHQTSLASGWWPANKMERSVPEMLLLLHRNVAKATDAYRNQNSVIEGYDWKVVFAEGLADVAIQILDMCEGRGADVPENFVYATSDCQIVDALMEMHTCISRAYVYVNSCYGDLLWPNVFDVMRTIKKVCDGCDIDMEAAILAKNEINKKRQYRHGNKVC